MEKLSKSEEVEKPSAPTEPFKYNYNFAELEPQKEVKVEVEVEEKVENNETKAE